MLYAIFKEKVRCPLVSRNHYLVYLKDFNHEKSVLWPIASV